MYKNITDLKNIHVGQDIWLLNAGASMNYIHNSFFENKITIGQNQLYKHFPCTYIVMKDCMEQPRFPRSVEECKQLNIPLIFSLYYKGRYDQILNTHEYYDAYVFDHNPRKQKLVNELPELLDNQIITSKSTVTSLMHIAAYMGAKNIILCGHDCGSLDGDLYFDGYIEDDWISSGNWSGIKSWMSDIEYESQLVRNYLMHRYNCNIYSLNPFLNLSLESHTFIKV